MYIINSSSEPQYYQEGIYQQYFLLTASVVVGVISLILNLLAAIVFQLRINNAASMGIRILVIIEINYTVSRITGDSMWLCQRPLPFPYVLIVIDSCIITRNFWIAVLSLYRCLAICAPLSLRQIKVSHQIITVSLIALMSVVGALTRYHNLLYQSATVFLLQAGIPIPIVIVASITMLIFLLRPEQFTNIGPKIQRATRTIFCFALFFVMLEGPTFITEMMPEVVLRSFPLINPICNLLTILDSASNLVVLVCCSRHFRNDLKSFFAHGFRIDRLGQLHRDCNHDSVLYQRRSSLASKFGITWTNKNL